MSWVLWILVGLCSAVIYVWGASVIGSWLHYCRWRQEEKERQAGLSRLTADVRDPSRLTPTEIEEVRK